MKDLKTTLAGLVPGLLLAVDALIQAYASGQFEGKTGKQLLIAAGLFLIGWYATDKKKPNGDVQSTDPVVGDRPGDRG